MGNALTQFKWVDSDVIPKGAAPEIENIVQHAPGILKHILRVGNGWADGDRKITTGRQSQKGRAEVCCLHQNTPYKVGETWLIGSTLMFAPDFVPPPGYFQVAQPVLHQSFFNINKLSGNTMSGGMYVFEQGLGSPNRLVRKVSVKRGEWMTWTLKVKFGKDGYYGLSINGDEFQGFNIDTSVGHIQGANVGVVNAHGGTWGAYCPHGGSPRTMVVYHAKPFIKKIG